MRILVGLTLACALQLMLARPVAAQRAPSPGERTAPGIFQGANTPPLPDPSQGQQTQRESHAVMWGALTGATVAAVATFSGAATYGRNEGAEGGRMCGRCFMEWSTITIPIGTGIGAAVGFAVQQIRRQTGRRPLDPHGIVVSPVLGKRSGGLAVSARF
jgi:hypothetical protein